MAILTVREYMTSPDFAECFHDFARLSLEAKVLNSLNGTTVSSLPELSQVYAQLKSVVRPSYSDALILPKTSMPSTSMFGFFASKQKPDVSRPEIDKNQFKK